MRNVCLAAVAACLALPAIGGEIYSWKDASGQVHYSDVPPPSGQYESVRKTPDAPASSAATPPAAKPKSYVEQELEFRKRRAEEQEKEAKAKEQADKNAEKQRYCEQARNQLAALQSGQRIARPGPNGEREFLTDQQRQQEIERTQKSIDQVCSKNN